MDDIGTCPYNSHPCCFFGNLHTLSLQGMQNVSDFVTKVHCLVRDYPLESAKGQPMGGFTRNNSIWNGLAIYTIVLPSTFYFLDACFSQVLCNFVDLAFYCHAAKQFPGAPSK